MAIEAVDPVTGETVARYDEIEPDEAARVVDAVHEAFLAWRRTSYEERALPLRRAARLLRSRREELALLMAREMGKPVTQGRAEADKCAWVCEHYAESAEGYLAPERVRTEAHSSLIVHQPLGVVLAVMPWNFPLWQVFRFAAPALMAGNAAVLKHASNVPGCALAIEDVLAEAGLPDGVFRTLLASARLASELVGHPRIAAVTLTGSEAAGRAVASRAGAELKKSVMELGGSDAYLVLEDADVERAAAASVQSRLINAGQSCIAAKRLIVVERHRRRFEELVVEAMRAARLGDPRDESTEVGPLARRDLVDALDRQVAESLERGARVLLEGGPAGGPGFFFRPTVLTDVRRGCPAFDEELFGPVAAIVPVADDAEAVRRANESRFGLGAAVFTRDLAQGQHIASRELEAGCCFVNDLVRSDPRLPFGGVKQSGYGRELAAAGIREFVNVKTVWVA